MPRRMEKIREAGVNELEAQEKELIETIFRLRCQLSTGQAEALKRLREARKDLARVKTLRRAHQHRSARTRVGWSEEIRWPKRNRLKV